MFDDLNDLYQQVILDHCKKPRNFHEMPGATCSAQGHNPLCGDRLKLFLALEGDKIADASFLGEGCCISKASASLLTDNVKGKSKAEVHAMFDLVQRLAPRSGNSARNIAPPAVDDPVYPPADRFIKIACRIPRAAEADIARFQQDDRPALLGQVHCQGDAGNAASDNQDIGSAFLPQYREILFRRCGAPH